MPVGRKDPTAHAQTLIACIVDVTCIVRAMFERDTLTGLSRAPCLGLKEERHNDALKCAVEAPKQGAAGRETLAVVSFQEGKHSS